VSSHDRPASAPVAGHTRPCRKPTPLLEPDSYATHWDRRTGEVIVVDGHACRGDLEFATPASASTESPATANDPDAGADTAPEATVVDAALTEHGFIRAAAWIRLDETSRIWRTDVYQHSTH
jgi:hypothetical protein